LKGWKLGLFVHFGKFSCSWIRIQESQIGADSCGSGFETLQYPTVPLILLNTYISGYVLFQVDLGQYLAMYRSQVDGDPGEEGEEEGGNTDNTDNTDNTGNTDNTTTPLQNDIQQGPSEVKF
jgi:hypothetical protein